MAVKFRDYYEILGMPQTASKDEVKKNFRRLARKYHPDVNPGDKIAEEKFKEINEAYMVLSDPEKRRRYDQLGANYKEGVDFTPPPDWENGQVNFEDLNDLFGEGVNVYDFSDFFTAFFGAKRQPRNGTGLARKGDDVEAELALSLRSAHQGGPHHFSLEIAEKCHACNGAGLQNSKICPICKGQGVAKRRKQLEVTIPVGVREGVVIRLAGLGRPGAEKAPSGDLYLRVKLKADPFFAVLGDDDVQIEIPLTPWEAVLGAQVKTPTLDGTVEMTIPAGSQTGQRLRLKGQGLRQRDGGRGDQYVKLKVVVPTLPTEKELDLFARLAAESRFKPRAAGGNEFKGRLNSRPNR
jgi:curved DNA-binding protein